MELSSTRFSSITPQTGTLTQNIMVFLKCSINGVRYGRLLKILMYSKVIYSVQFVFSGDVTTNANEKVCVCVCVCVYIGTCRYWVWVQWCV